MTDKNLDRRLRRIELLLVRILAKENLNMTQMETLAAQVATVSDAEDSAVIVMNKLVSLYTAAAASGDMTQVVALTAQLKSHTDPLAAAIATDGAAGATGPTGPTGATGVPAISGANPIEQTTASAAAK